MAESSVEDYVKGGGGKDAPPSFDVGSPSVPMLSAQPAPDQGLGKLEKEAGALRADTAAAEATIKANSAKKLSIADQISQLKPPDLPKTEPPMKPPGEGPQYNPLEAFGSPASWLAVFGGLLTRRPLQASLDASASAMKAYRERDLEAYEQHLKTWKVQADYAGKLQQYQLDLYRTAMDRHKGDIDQLMTQFNLIASANQDVTMLHTLKSGDFGLSEKLYHDRVQQQQHYEDRKLKLEEFAERRRHDLNMENTPERNAYQTYLDEHPNATADDKARFLQALKKTGSAALKPEQQFMSRWLTEHPDATAADMARAMAEYHAMGAKKTPQTLAVEKWLEEHGDEDDLATKLQHFIVGFKEDADGVAARKDRKLDQGDERIAINREKMLNDREYKADVIRLKDRQIDGREAEVAARADYWARQGDQKDRALDQADERILNDREYKADIRELKSRGLTLAEQNAVALERWRNRQGDQKDRALDITDTKVMNDQFYKEDVLKLRARGLDQADARELALENYRDRALAVRKEVTGAKHETAVAQTNKLITQADDLLRQIDDNPNVVGGRGIVGGLIQTGKGMIDPRAKVNGSYQRFETSLKAFRTEVNLAISQSKYYSSARMAEMAKTLPGLERFQSAQDATTAIETMKGLLTGAKMELGDAPAPTSTTINALSIPGGITPADLETTARENGITIEAAKAKLRSLGLTVP